MEFEQTSTEIQRLTLNITFLQGEIQTQTMKDHTGRCLLPLAVQITQSICLQTWVIFAPPCSKNKATAQKLMVSHTVLHGVVSGTSQETRWAKQFHELLFKLDGENLSGQSQCSARFTGLCREPVRIGLCEREKPSVTPDLWSHGWELHNSHVNTIRLEPKPPDLLLKADVCLILYGAKCASLRKVYQASEAGDFLFGYQRNCQNFFSYLHENNFTRWQKAEVVYFWKKGDYFVLNQLSSFNT